MKASEVVYAIKNLKAGGIQSQSDSISDLQYLAMVDYYRAQLIRQQQDKGYKVNGRLIQDLGELTLSTNDDITYVTDEIPNPIEAGNSILITDVRDSYGIPYQKSTVSTVQWSHYSRLTKDTPKWFAIGRRVGVINHASNERLKISGVFESPLEVLRFKQEVNELDSLDFEYPISTTMIDTIYKMIIDAEFRLVMSTRQDTLNDSADENQG